MVGEVDASVREISDVTDQQATSLSGVSERLASLASKADEFDALFGEFRLLGAETPADAVRRSTSTD